MALAGSESCLHIPRMPRIPRSRQGRGVYHVINRALNRQFIFERDGDKQAFLELLASGLRNHEVTVYHWVIMSNHFHLAVEVRKTEELSAWLANATRRYSRLHHKRSGGCGPLWQGRFRSILVEKEGYLGKLGRYVERNPVRAGMVEEAGDYLYSSAGAYLENRTDALVRPKDSAFYASMGETPEDRIETYRRYLQSNREREEDAALFRSRVAVIGGEDFVANVRRQHGRLASRSPGRPRNAKRYNSAE